MSRKARYICEGRQFVKTSNVKACSPVRLWVSRTFPVKGKRSKAVLLYPQLDADRRKAISPSYLPALLNHVGPSSSVTSYARSVSCTDRPVRSFKVVVKILLCHPFPYFSHPVAVRHFTGLVTPSYLGCRRHLAYAYAWCAYKCYAIQRSGMDEWLAASAASRI